MDVVVHNKLIFDECSRKLEKRSWPCMFPGCNRNSIKSHVLQKNGILSQIQNDNHVIEVKPTKIWEIERKGILDFQKIGLNDAFTFLGFCSFHDSILFKPIESVNINFDNYIEKCLFCYRGLCQEIRRKEQVKYLVGLFLQEWKRFKSIDTKELFEDYHKGLAFGLLNLSFFKSEFEVEILENSKGIFDFYQRKSPLFEICTSAPLNIKEPGENDPVTMEEFETKALNEKLPTAFVNIFPYNHESIWLIGQHKNYPSSYYAYLSNGSYEELLSELLILRMEYWCMSNDFYKKHVKPKIKLIKYIFMENALNFDYHLKTPFNLFK